MPLCHDERDFAMGFSRHDPHIKRGPTAGELRRAEERRQYLKSLTPARKRAYERVQFCLQAVGQYFVAKGEMTPILLDELHKYFPAFAREMGYRGPFYQNRGGRCQAIDISFPESSDSIWFIAPYFNYYKLGGEEKLRADTREARSAALAFCQSWLPLWKWEPL